MTSIRRKLIASILSVVLFVTLFLATATYFSVREEMDEFYDENLKQVAQMILNTKPDADITSLSKTEIDTKLRGEEEYLIQVWHAGELEYSSHPTVDIPFYTTDGYKRISFRNGTWRFYKESYGETSVQLAQDLNERHSIVIELYGALLLPILLQLPILAGLIWVLIGHGLKPLSHISSLIKNRNPSFLDSLPDEDIPVEVNVLVDSLNGLLRRLKEALETQRRFTADAAHELRTPLAAIRLQLDILKRADNVEEKADALHTLEKGILRSTRLVEQLLELARQEPENAETAFAPVDLADIVKEAVDQNHPISQSKNITLKTEILHRSCVDGNTQKLSVMIGNLIGNAIGYTKNGGHVEVTLRQDDTKIILDIADDGIGIAQKDRERIFDRFYRVAGTGATGSGLGLSIVRSIADIHRAEIEILEGLKGKGTTFRVLFPL